LLLDSHTLIWAVDDPGKLGNQASQSLQTAENELLLSAATIWEIAIKVGLNKLSLTIAYQQWMTQAIDDLGLQLLPITVKYADEQIRLPNRHRDPFDRLLVAQAIVERVPIVSNDSSFDAYNVQRMW
jgi:PIN domain nuclease of toxin-antitoxin system